MKVRAARRRLLILPDVEITTAIWRIGSGMHAGRHQRSAKVRARKRALHAAWQPISRNLYGLSSSTN
jgi:hypothetical protein